jgi:hypothetical protein
MFGCSKQWLEWLFTAKLWSVEMHVIIPVLELSNLHASQESMLCHYRGCLMSFFEDMLI